MLFLITLEVGNLNSNFENLFILPFNGTLSNLCENRWVTLCYLNNNGSV